MSINVEKALTKITDPILYNKLKDAEKNKKADAKQLLIMAKRGRAAAIFRRILIAAGTLFIIPLLYFFKARYDNKKNEEVGSNVRNPLNYFKVPSHEIGEGIKELKKLAAAEDKEASDQTNKKTFTSFNSEETSEQSKNVEKFKHSLGDTHGAMHQLSIEKNTNTSYSNRTAATILNNGNILACDIGDQHRHRAIGIFDEKKTLLKELFQFKNSGIEKMVALEYAPEKFVYFYMDAREFFNITYDNGQHSIYFPYAENDEKPNKIIPLQFELSERDLKVAFLAVLNNSIKSLAYTMTARDQEGSRYDQMQKPLYRGEREVTATTYHEPTAALFISTSADEIIRLPLEMFGDKGLLSIKAPGQRTFKINPSDHPITHIAIGEERRYAIARQDGTINICKEDINSNLEKFFEIPTNPNELAGEILDLKFANGDLVIAASKNSLVISKKEIDEMLSITKKPNDHESVKALRKMKSKKGARLSQDAEEENREGIFLK